MSTKKITRESHDSHLRVIGPFPRLAASQALSAFATRGFDVTLIWLAVTEVGSGTDVGLILFFKFLPYAVFGLVGGWLGDMISRQKMVVFSDLLRGLLLFSMAPLILKGSNFWVLSGVSFLFTTLRTISQPASQGLLPEIVEGTKLGKANALLHGLMETAQTIFPVITGLLLKLAQPWISAVILGSVFVGAALLVPKPAAEAAVDPGIRTLSISSVFTSYKHTVVKLQTSGSEIFGVMVLIPVSILGAGGMMNFSLPELLIGKGIAHEDIYGIVLGSMSIGTILGAYLYRHLAVYNAIVVLYTGWILYGLMIYVMSLQTEIVQFALYGAVAGIVGSVADVSLATLLQQAATEAEMSKTFALFSTLANACEALSAPAMSLITAYLSLHLSFAIGAFIIVTSCACGIFMFSARTGKA